jgi:hypothetical protein
MADRFLSIHLNDHLAGSAAGVELARRLRDSNEDDPEMGPPLAQVCGEIEDDREVLETLMDRLGVRREPLKPLLAWAGEKLGRLKPNGQLRGYSPLSRLVELEGLTLGVTGQMQLWRGLERSLDSVAGFDFERMAERAAGHREQLEGLRLKAAVRAFTGSPPRSR